MNISHQKTYKIGGALVNAARHFTSGNHTDTYGVETQGSEYDFRAFLTRDSKRISPWHDVELNSASKDTFNGFFELSFNDLKKLEVDPKAKHNPVKQDTNKSRHSGEKQLRYYAKFPMFNYGMLPKTWENSKLKDSKTQAYGDNVSLVNFQFI